jgi:hypothetical protein
MANFVDSALKALLVIRNAIGVNGRADQSCRMARAEIYLPRKTWKVHTRRRDPGKTFSQAFLIGSVRSAAGGWVDCKRNSVPGTMSKRLAVCLGEQSRYRHDSVHRRLSRDALVRPAPPKSIGACSPRILWTETTASVTRVVSSAAPTWLSISPIQDSSESQKD